MRRKFASNAAAVAAAFVGVTGFAGGANAQACGTNVISALPLAAGETDGLAAQITVDTVWGDATNPETALPGDKRSRTLLRSASAATVSLRRSVTMNSARA